MKLRAVKINKTTKEKLEEGFYPRWDGKKVVGLDPDHKWLLVVEKPQPESYDTEVFRLKKVEKATTIPHPDYPQLHQYEITYELVKRDIKEIESDVNSKEDRQNNEVFNFELKDKLIVKALDCIFRNMDQSTFKEGELETVRKIAAIAEQFRLNRKAAQDKITEITTKLNLIP
jgi:hypothetical protein